MITRGIAVLALALWMPAISGAESIYDWQGGDGLWTDPGKWKLAFGSTPNSYGYPNGRGDRARFGNALQTDVTVTIPSASPVTVGMIETFTAFDVTLRTPILAPRLIFDADQSTAKISTGVSGGDLIVFAPVELQSDLEVAVQMGQVKFSRIVEAGGSRTVAKFGPGIMVYEGRNEYTGRTEVRQGLLELDSVVGHSIAGEIRIGAALATVSVLRPQQIDDAATVSVSDSGIFEVEEAERIGELILDNARASVRSATGILTLGRLTMNGGVLEAGFDGEIELDGPVTATSSANRKQVASIRLLSHPARLDLRNASRTFTVDDGPLATDLEIDIAMVGEGTAGLIKDGAGTLGFIGNQINTYPGTTRVLRGSVDLYRSPGATAVPGRFEIGAGLGAAAVVMPYGAGFGHNIADTADVVVGPDGVLLMRDDDAVRSLSVEGNGHAIIGSPSGSARLIASSLSMTAGRVTFAVNGSLRVDGDVAATSAPSGPAVIEGAPGGGGVLTLQSASRTLVVHNGPHAIDLRLDTVIEADPDIFVKRGAGVVEIVRNMPATLVAIVEQGTLLASGTLSDYDVTVTGGRLGGTGAVRLVNGPIGTIAPGLSPGRLTTGPLSLSAGVTVAAELNGTTAGTGYDQLAVTGAVTLGNAALALTPGFTAPANASFTIIANDGSDAIPDTFAGLAEGATLTVAGQTFTISYRGGDGNDVVVTKQKDVAPATALTYFLAEGATGGFFDDDVLIANPTETTAAVTLTFLQEGGSTVVEHRTVPAQSRLTVHVDQIAGLESSSASVQVASDDRVPLIVERSMFWDASYYGGHTANAVAQPETKWIFAEGFQGFFDTYILIANANTTATTATLTFLREGDTPIVKTVPVEAFARKTVYAGEYDELVGRAFGVVVEATQPVIAERSMYFASLPNRLWTGGHVNTGIVAPSTSWFHAEGATGGFFNTFILLSNPQDTAAHVELRFLLDTGDVITRQKTIEARQRLTINPATEGDARLENAAVSTVVQSDVAIVSERSMYWPGDASPFGEGHNSAGVVSTSTRWGLAEGRIGGPHAFDTFILLANPSAQAANVTITYLRETGAPIVRTYTVPATSRFNVDVKSDVPELIDSSFGARIEVTNSMPIAVERSLYWNANGVFWAGGTNALATPLP